MAPDAKAAWDKNMLAPSLESLAERVGTDDNAEEEDKEMEVVFENGDILGDLDADRAAGSRSVPLFHTRNAGEDYDTRMRNKKGSMTPAPKRRGWKLDSLHIDTRRAKERYKYNPESGEYSPLTPRSRFLRSVNERRSDRETYMSSVGRTSHFVKYVNGQEDEVGLGRWLMKQKQGSASCFDAPSPVPFEVLMNELLIQQRLSNMSASMVSHSRVTRR